MLRLHLETHGKTLIEEKVESEWRLSQKLSWGDARELAGTPSPEQECASFSAASQLRMLLAPRRIHVVRAQDVAP